MSDTMLRTAAAGALQRLRDRDRGNDDRLEPLERGLVETALSEVNEEITYWEATEIGHPESEFYELRAALRQWIEAQPIKLKPKWGQGEEARASVELKAAAHKLWFGELLAYASPDERLMDILGPLCYSEPLIPHTVATKAHVALLGYLPGEIAIGNVNPDFFALLNLLYDYCGGTETFDNEAKEWVRLEEKVARRERHAEAA